MRRALVFTHRWVALVTGLVLLVTSASGASLVFENAIDRALNPELWFAEGSGPPLSLDTLAARVAASGAGHTVSSMNLTSAPDRAFTASAGGLSVFINPYTGAITGTRTPQQSQATLARLLHVLHVELFAGPTGRSIVGIASGIALLLVLSGTILWWRDKFWRVNTGASWKRINFDVHHAAGIFASLVLIVITTSGLVVHYDGLAKAIQSLDTTPPPPPPKQPDNASGAARTPSFDALAAAARTALPGAEVMFISLGAKQAPATVAVRFPEDRTPAGRSRVFLDRYTDSVLAVTSTRNAQIGTRLDNLKRSVHTGDVLGPVTSALWFIATLFLMSQVITGALMWWNARRARRALKRATAPRAA